MKRSGDDLIICGLFVDINLKSIPTSKRLLDEFLKKYRQDFNITGGEVMDSFIGLQVEQQGNANFILITTCRKSSISTRSTTRGHFARSAPPCSQA